MHRSNVPVQLRRASFLTLIPPFLQHRSLPSTRPSCSAATGRRKPSPSSSREAPTSPTARRVAARGAQTHCRQPPVGGTFHLPTDLFQPSRSCRRSTALATSSSAASSSAGAPTSCAAAALRRTHITGLGCQQLCHLWRNSEAFALRLPQGLCAGAYYGSAFCDFERGHPTLEVRTQAAPTVPANATHRRFTLCALFSRLGSSCLRILLR